MAKIFSFSEFRMNEADGYKPAKYTPLVDAMCDLVSGIENDKSIQRYSLQWKDVIEEAYRLFKLLKFEYKRNDRIQFSNDLITNCLAELYKNEDPGETKELIDILEKFATELDINIQSLRSK